MPLVETDPPEIEVLSLADAKTFLRVDGSDEDDLVEALVAAATTIVEARLGQQLITAGWELRLPCFPSDEIRLTPPLQSVEAVLYYDAADVLQTLDEATYEVDAARKPGRLRLADGYSWPETYDRLDAVTVQFTCGYGDLPADVPPNLVMAIRQLVAWWHAQRMPVNVGNIVSAVPMAVDALLAASAHGEYV